MQTHQKRTARFRISIDDVHGAAAEHIRQISHLMHLDIVVPQIVFLVGVRVVVDSAAAESVEMIVSALQRAEFRKQAQMPFSNQRGAVAGFLQQRRQGGMVGRQADIASRQRLLQPDRQPVLVAAGDQRGARCRTDRGVGVGLQKPHALRRQSIDVRRADIGTPVTRHVGIAEIVGHDEDDVRALRAVLPEQMVHAGRNRDSSKRGVAQQRTARHRWGDFHGCSQLLRQQSVQFTHVNESGRLTGAAPQTSGHRHGSEAACQQRQHSGLGSASPRRRIELGHQAVSIAVVGAEILISGQ